MGGADIIPGVSGGTIALISGIYEHLVQAISSVGFKQIVHALKLPFVLGNESKRKESLEVLGEIPWIFLLTLIAGILTGILSMSRIIPIAMEEYPYFTYAFFFGLILFSLTIPFRKMDHKPIEYLIALAFAAVTFLIVGSSSVSGAMVQFTEEVDGVLSPSSATTVHTDNNGKWVLTVPVAELNDVIVGEANAASGDRLGTFRLERIQSEGEIPQFNLTSEFTGAGVMLRKVQVVQDQVILTGALTLEGSASPWHLFISGFLAISAMILPGISGAYILVLLGEYKTVLTALHEHDLMVVGIFVAGIALGIFTFIRILKFLLENYHSWTMAALTGIMAGSMIKIWPGSYLEGGEDTAVILGGVAIAIFGAILVFALERASVKLDDPDSPL